jgi:hypothetical protein
LGAKNQPLNGQTETYFQFLCFYVFMFAYMNPLITCWKFGILLSLSVHVYDPT